MLCDPGYSGSDNSVSVGNCGDDDHHNDCVNHGDDEFFGSGNCDNSVDYENANGDDFNVGDDNAGSHQGGK